jgi:hypothetical protein
MTVTVLGYTPTNTCVLCARALNAKRGGRSRSEQIAAVLLLFRSVGKTSSLQRFEKASSSSRIMRESSPVSA